MTQRYVEGTEFRPGTRRCSRRHAYFGTATIRWCLISVYRPHDHAERNAIPGSARREPVQPETDSPYPDPQCEDRRREDRRREDRRHADRLDAGRWLLLPLQDECRTCRRTSERKSSSGRMRDSERASDEPPTQGEQESPPVLILAPRPKMGGPKMKRRPVRPSIFPLPVHALVPAPHARVFQVER